jgi:uncharacterized membrane protein
MNNDLQMMTSLMTATAIGLIAFTAAMACLAPRLTRRDLYFAVTVPPGFRDSEQGREILRHYRARVLAQSLIASALILVGAMFHWLAALGAGIAWQYAGCFLAYLRARRQVMPGAVRPTTVREASLEPRSVRLPGGWVLQAGPYAVLAAAGFYLWSRWTDIPERFPNHWGLDGLPNGWGTRTLRDIFGFLLVAAVNCLLLTVLSYGLRHWSRPVQLTGTAGRNEARFKNAGLSVMLGIEYLLALSFSWASLAQVRSNVVGPLEVSLMGALSLVFAVAAVAILVRMGQGGARLAERSGEAVGGWPVGSAASAAPVGDGTLDRYWKAGIFYVNPDDPAIFVEKRLGIGYTLNFARVGAWILLLLTLLVPIALTLWLIAGVAHG